VACEITIRQAHELLTKWFLGRPEKTATVRIAAYLLVIYGGPGWTSTTDLALISIAIILRDIGCGPARQSKADALVKVAATRGRGALKEQQALACLGT
jgi:hypothetical protein